MSLTGSPDTDIEVLLNLDYPDLLNVCQIDSYLNSLCRRDDFWRRKVERDYGPDVAALKPQNETDREQYNYLQLAKDSDNQASVGRVDAVISLYRRRGLLPSKDGANRAASYGHLNLLDWLEEHEILPDVEGANWAFENGQFGVVDWLTQRGIIPRPLYFNVASRAAVEGRIDILNYIEQIGFLPVGGSRQVVIQRAAMAGQLPVLEWFAQRGRFPNEYGIRAAAHAGKGAVLQWASRHGIST